jgi:hypothetical protein
MFGSAVRKINFGRIDTICKIDSAVSNMNILILSLNSLYLYITV